MFNTTCLGIITVILTKVHLIVPPPPGKHSMSTHAILLFLTDECTTLRSHVLYTIMSVTTKESTHSILSRLLLNITCGIPRPIQAYLCRSYPCLGVDRHDRLSPSFSVLCELCVELMLFQIAPHSVHPPQSGPSSRSLPSHLHRRYLLCNIRVFSSHSWPYHERRFWATYVVIGLTIASLLNFSFLNRSFLVLP